MKTAFKRVPVRLPRVMVDEWVNHGKRIGRAGPYWCHLTVEAFDFPRLHAFAQELGLTPSWFQGHYFRPELWHYDIGSERLYDKALNMGAVFVPGMEQARANLKARRAREERCFTNVEHCGSGFRGDPPKPLGTLGQMLRNWELEPFWQTNFGVRPFRSIPTGSGMKRLPAPWYADPTILRFQGNFARYSFGFRVDTNDPALILSLRAAQAFQPKRETFTP